MKIQTLSFLAGTGALGLALLAFPALSQVNPTTGASASVSATTTTNTAPAPAADANPVAAVSPASGAADILKMLDAGVSADVIKTYIQNSSTGWNLSAEDLIALKQRGVADEITVELLNHRGTAAAATSAPNGQTGSTGSQQVVAVVHTGNLDPEGYEFFQHYYLFPRTLAYVNQTLGYGPGGGYPFGYARPRRFFAPAMGYQFYPGP